MKSKLKTMRESNVFFKETFLSGIMTSTVILLTVFLLNTAYAQLDKSDKQPNKSDFKLNAENSYKIPFVSNGNPQLNAQSFLQNSEKDIIFIENLGQIRDSKGNKRPDVLFLTRSQCVDMYVTNSGISYVFRKTEGNTKDKSIDIKTKYHRLDMEFLGMNKNIKIKKELAVEQQFNYYTPEYPNGISPKGYKKVIIENIYDGIDLIYYEKEGKMKYDFLIKAGANAREIKMKYKGAGSVYLNKDGSLIVTTPMGEIREEKPFTYSESTGLNIESGYKVIDNVVQFYIAEFNKSEKIIIDPFRVWATYYGGNSNDRGEGIYTDNSGNLFITGGTHSNNFPTKVLSGAYNQTIFGGTDDVFILKFNSSGVRIWATYYGGSNDDWGYNIHTDNSGNLYVTGRTGSSNFPTLTLTGAYNQTIYGGGNVDAFILKFNSSGTRLWATYYGGNNGDYGQDLCTDNSGNLYIVGYTWSPNFPLKILPGAYNQTYNNNDAFILKFNNSSSRIWATCYGGSHSDFGKNISIDNSGNLYVTGPTHSSNFPTQILPGAYNQTTHGGGSYDAFILKFNSSDARLWATYYGGGADDWGENISTDNSGNVYVTGSTQSSNFPTQTFTGAYNQTTSNGGWDAFILKFNSSGARIWATYYGGSSDDYDYGTCIDNSGNLYVTGWTQSTNFPTQTLLGGYNQTTNGGLYDAFILKFNNSSSRIWATYYGGNMTDEGWNIWVDNSSNVYVTGWTQSYNFPTQTLPGGYNQTTNGGLYDAFILKFGGPPPPPVLVSPPNGATLVATNPLLDWNSSATAQSYRVQVSTNMGFTSTVYDSSNITITQFQIPNNGLSINTIYYWRVNATNIAGSSAYSNIFSFATGSTNISGNNEIPKEFKLYNNYPNPFNPSTNIKFDIPKSSNVKISIYNMLGKEVAKIVNEKLSAGSYQVDWNASGFTSGVYFYRLETKDYVQTKKMLLIK